MTKDPNTQARMKPEAGMTNHGPELKEEARGYWQEAKDLHLIFAKIY